MPGWAPGWIDNGHLLVNDYRPGNVDTGYDGDTGATIYDQKGDKRSALVPPEMFSLQPVSATSVYSRLLNAIVATTSGALQWTSGDDATGEVGAIAGSRAVSVSGTLVLTQPYEWPKKSVAPGS